MLLRHPLAELHFATAVSLRNALFREATCQDSPLHFLRWNADSHHFNAAGHELVSVLVHHWMHDVQYGRPFDVATGEAEAGAGTAERSLPPEAALACDRECPSQMTTSTKTMALCFSFDDTFDAFEPAPASLVPDHTARIPPGGPLLAAPTDCVYRQMANSSHGLLRKPGYECTRPGQTMLLNTTVRDPNDTYTVAAAGLPVPWQVRVGYLKTISSHAAASFACRGGCTCKRVNVSAFSRSNSLLGEARLRAHAVVRAGFCMVEVAVTRCDLGDAFKLISLTVVRRGSGRTSSLDGRGFRA